jgi:hypothetical protein
MKKSDSFASVDLDIWIKHWSIQTDSKFASHSCNKNKKFEIWKDNSVLIMSKSENANSQSKTLHLLLNFLEWMFSHGLSVRTDLNGLMN